jgi:serine/threonine protein kinase
VEISPSEEAGTSNQCPHCGGAVDSQADQSDARTKIAEVGGEVRSADLGLRDSSSDWAETWSRGSLGSLGRFQLRERLGDGGFGQVFLAFDPRLDRDVALKVLKEPNPSERVMERFFREARSAARLDHPNIVAVHDAGFEGGRCWVAYHYVSGRPLSWYRDQHRLDPPTAARILRELADAVDHAHRQGVLHRDIKPANVLIDDHGRPRLIDFGLARRSDLESSLTHDGAVVGTPAYMSPEQALGFSRQVDERSDVFSLGVIFFEVLSGRRPYPSATQGEGTQVDPQSPAGPGAIPPPSVRALNPEVPIALDRICRRAIAQDPRDRYPSARALADDLDLWLLAHRGGKVRLSFAITTVILGLAAALLLVIAVRTTLVPWRENPRLDTAQAVAPQRPLVAPAAVQLIGNVRKGLYHLSTCIDTQNMSEHNRLVLKDAAQAAAQGLRPCGHCHPPVSPAPAKVQEGG